MDALESEPDALESELSAWCQEYTSTSKANLVASFKVDHRSPLTYAVDIGLPGGSALLGWFVDKKTVTLDNVLYDVWNEAGEGVEYRDAKRAIMKAVPPGRTLMGYVTSLSKELLGSPPRAFKVTDDLTFPATKHHRAYNSDDISKLAVVVLSAASDRFSSTRSDFSPDQRGIYMAMERKITSMKKAYTSQEDKQKVWERLRDQGFYGLLVDGAPARNKMMYSTYVGTLCVVNDACC